MICSAVLAVLLLCAAPASALPVVEDTFSSAPGPLAGTTPGVGGTWTALSPAADKIQVTAGNLPAPVGLLESAGNKVSWAGAGEDASIAFSNQNSGTVYYSLLINLASVPNTAGVNLASLGSSAGYLAASLAIRRDAVDPTKYNIGFFSRQSLTGPLFSPQQLSTNTTQFLVISYTFVPGANNDVIKLWLNPDAATFGQGEPAPTLSLVNVNVSGDISNLAYFFLWQRDSQTPNLSIDELVVATSWAEVTPPAGDLTVETTMGSYNFSWTFDKPVTHGTFVDGQPWVIRPAGGLNLVATTPARQNGVVVENKPMGRPMVLVSADINMTVINPPIADYYDVGAVARFRSGSFGWDSRGCLRNDLNPANPITGSYSPALPWDGTTPKALQIGDSVTTAYSRTSNIKDTPLDAVAVLTVLESPPPAQAFRPGFTRSASRRATPEWFTLTQMIDLTPHLIAQPTTNLHGTPLIVFPTSMTAAKLTSILPGPSIMNHSATFSQSCNATYNNSGVSYGGDVAKEFGDLSIGALAAWLTPADRLKCQIQFLQRAIDTYESIQAGLYLTHDGGFLQGYAAMITIAGRMLNHPGMLAVNQPAGLPLNLAPEFYFADFSQCFYMMGATPGPDAPPVGPRRIDFRSANIKLNRSNVSVKSSSGYDVTIQDNFAWTQYRSARAIPNMKLRVTSGTGSGSTIYVVTGISNYMNVSGSTAGVTESTEWIYGGRLTVKPAWQNGNPNSTSKLAFSAASLSDLPRWGFRAWGSQRSPNYVMTFDATKVGFSPKTDYSDINAGAYLALMVSMYALDAESYYKGGFDKWLIQVSNTAGYGEHLLSSSNAKYTATTILTGFEASNVGGAFRGGLWRRVLVKTNSLPFKYTDGTMNNLPVPPAGSPLWLD